MEAAFGVSRFSNRNPSHVSSSEKREFIGLGNWEIQATFRHNWLQRLHRVTRTLLLFPSIGSACFCMTSLADRLCLGGLKAGVSKIKSSSQQLIPEERTAVLFSPSLRSISDPGLAWLCVCPRFNHGFPRVGVSDWTTCHMATPVTRQEGCF